MATADELLNNLSMTNSEDEGYIVIGPDRHITVPNSLKKIAVEHDHNIETVTFKCPRYWDEHDLSKLILYINYRLPNGEIGSYIAKSIKVVDDDNFTFTWTIRREVTKYKGNISFLVCAKSTELEGDEALEILHWNTELCTDVYISEGLEAEAPLEEEYPDIVTQLLERMTEVENVAEAISSIRNTNGTITSQNADFAEVGEWADGNPDNEDRIGYFVSIDDTNAGTTMIKATANADVRGVTVLAPAFSGNCSADKYNEDKTLKQQYEYVATMGIVSVIDNGTCEINGRCMPDNNGCAVPSSNNLGYQVIDRIDDTHILIALEPNGNMVQRIKTDISRLQEEIPSVDQTFNPTSENAQSGIAIDKYVTDNFSDIIIETSHSVNSPAEIDGCLKGQKIVGGNIFGAEPQIVQNKNLCPTPEPIHKVKYDNNSNIIGEYTLTVNSDGTFNTSYTGEIQNYDIPEYAYVKVPAGVYTISGYVPGIVCHYDDAINEPTVTRISSSAINSVIIARFEKSGFIVVHDEGGLVNAENLYIQIEEGTKATPFVKYNGRQLYLPKNPIMHFSPVNPIQNRTFIGDEITFGEIYSNYLSYKFNSNYATGFSVNSARIEIGQEYIMRFEAACYTRPYNTWSFGVFSAQKCSSAYNVAAKSLLTIRLARTGEIVYQSDYYKASYTNFSKLNLNLKIGTTYIIELVFTSSYSGEVYFGMRAEGKPVSLGLKSCMFCKPESLPMLVDQKINTNLLRIGNIYDSIDLATGQKIQQIMMDELSFEEEQLVVNNYDKALPSVPAYFVSGTLEDSDWIECVTPAAGTNNYKLSQPLSKGYIIYATRTPVTEQFKLALPVVCTDEFEVYTSSDDNMVPYFQTSVDTKKSASSYLKKISNAIISMGGNI